MPARLVHQQNAVRTGRDGLSEFSKAEVHRDSVEPAHHQGDTSVACRAYGPDDPSRLVADIAQPARGMAALLPDIPGPLLLTRFAPLRLSLSSRADRARSKDTLSPPLKQKPFAIGMVDDTMTSNDRQNAHLTGGGKGCKAAIC
jgi:hypothetical protein